MPEVEIQIGGRSFQVSCQEGEEHYLTSAAKMLDTEAAALAQQIGRLPEARMLLMAGLMLADKTAGVEDQLNELQGKLSDLEAKLAEKGAQLENLRNAPKPPAEKVEVPVIPQIVNDTLAELAARAESLADAVEEKLSA